MKNEPVAWMLKTGHGTKILEKKPYCEVDYWKPLYAHPVKEMILPTAITNSNSYHRKEITDEEMYELLEKYQGIELCKAVLRKAQEK